MEAYGSAYGHAETTFPKVGYSLLCALQYGGVVCSPDSSSHFFPFYFALGFLAVVVIVWF
jgi:hypothetical protein